MTFGRGIDKLQDSLRNKSPLIGFAHCIPPLDECSTVLTKFGAFYQGSVLSYQLQSFDSSFMILSNLEICNTNTLCNFHLPNLPLSFVSEQFDDKWSVTENEKAILAKLQISEQESISYERETILQSKCDLWFSLRKNRITSTNAHRTYQRKRSFSNLAETILNPPSSTDLPKRTQDLFNHGKTYEPIARNAYSDAMKLKLNRNVILRETGIVIQPMLYWLAASPDGIFFDPTSDTLGLLEIKCPATRKNSTPKELMEDETFYIGLDAEEKPYLKRDHHMGYFTQIQFAMGLAGIEFCDFIVYTLKGVIIARTSFDKDYFESLVKKCNNFYTKFMLPKLCST